MVRILAVGSAKWSDHRRTVAVLRKVMTIYRAPYTLVCDMGDGAPRHAAAAARQLGWTVEAHELDAAKCAKDCPPQHRRAGGPTGDWCPTAAGRNRNTMLDSGIDVVLSFIRPGRRDDQGTRTGQAETRRRGIGIWTIEQPRKDNGRGNQTE